MIGNSSIPPVELSIDQRVERLERTVGDRGQGLVKDSLQALGADREIRVEQLTDRERLDGVADAVGALRSTVALVLATQLTAFLMLAWLIWGKS